MTPTGVLRTLTYRPMPQGGRLSGPALLEALERGDRRALAEVTQVITSYLVRHGGLELRDHWDDLVQEVIVALLKAARKGSIRDERAFVHYAGMAARNKLVDLYRRRGPLSRADHAGDPEEALAQRDDRGTKRPLDLMVDLDRALDALPAVERRVVEAIYVQGHSYEEAARQVRVPLGTLKRYQSRGLKQLRRLMGLTRDRTSSNTHLGEQR